MEAQPEYSKKENIPSILLINKIRLYFTNRSQKGFWDVESSNAKRRIQRLPATNNAL